MPELTLPPNAVWEKLHTVAAGAKQDDISFVSALVGWYANGQGSLYKTTNGGDTWTEMLSKPGTYWRALGFIDENNGLLGNLGTDYFPGVTDETPLYRTRNGGASVEAVSTSGPTIKGLCSIDVKTIEFINAGQLEKRTIIHAAGRVGGPAWLLRSLDGGDSWRTIDMQPHLAMITDVLFWSESVGFVVGGTHSNVAVSNAVVLKTVDGGDTWKRVYTSSRPYELIWKIAMPTPADGFATVQSYAMGREDQRVVRTRDEGETWEEIPLVKNAGARQFGIGFISASTGWVGTAAGGFQTTNGGESWTPISFGLNVNKIRVLRDGGGFVAYAIGAQVHRLDGRSASHK